MAESRYYPQVVPTEQTHYIYRDGSYAVEPFNDLFAVYRTFANGLRHLITDCRSQERAVAIIERAKRH